MRLLETWVETPLAQAVGWTLLHSLWEGALVAAVLASALEVVRSARARYAVACIAILAVLGAVGVTLVRLIPQGVHGLHSAGMPPLPVWNVQPDRETAGSSFPSLDAVVPWLAPFWVVGVWIFILGRVVTWTSVLRLRQRGVCCPPERWQQKLIELRANLRLTRPVVILESCLAEVPLVVGHVRPVILLPVGVLAGLPAGQVEAILLHELAHIRRCDYLANVLQRSAECLLFYHPAVWWISRVIRAERENCCDDVVVATSGNVEDYALALATLEQNRWAVCNPAVAASGGSLMKRIRRLLYPERARGLWSPLFAAGVLLATVITAFAAWRQEQPGNIPSAPPVVQLIPFPDMPLAHFRLNADSSRAFKVLAHISNLTVTFAPDFRPRPVSLDLVNVKIEEVLRVVCDQSRSFWKPLTSNTLLVIADNEQNRREYGESTKQSWFERWPNEEVPYIITDSERTAFKKLTTDEAREMFISQFWERRNPNPGSSENLFKEEYYRRIAYANAHFASTRQGWRTDRGRICIMYGPPDEIDSHRSGGSYIRPDSEGGGTTLTYPFEQWRYRYIDGIGKNVIMEFVDVSLSGEFRMTLDPKAKYMKP